MLRISTCMSCVYVHSPTDLWFQWMLSWLVAEFSYVRRDSQFIK